MTETQRHAPIYRLAAFSLSLGFVLAAFLACGSGDSDGPLAEARITAAEGGEVRSGDGSFLLSIPPNALSEDTTISVKLESTDAASGDVEDQVGDTFALSPDGLQFSLPATVSLRLPIDDNSSEDGDAFSGLTVFDLFSVSANGDVTGLENVVNDVDVSAGTQTVSGELMHFSQLERTKLNLRMLLQQPDPPVKAVGEDWWITGAIGEWRSPKAFSTTWEFLSSGKIGVVGGQNSAGLRNIDTSGMYVGDIKQVGFSVRGNSVRSDSPSDLDDSAITVDAHIVCLALGPGTYTLKAEGTPKQDIEKGIRGRKARLSLTGKVDCVSAAAANATEAAVAAATRVADVAKGTPADVVAGFTPTSQPYPTAVGGPSPTPSPIATPTVTPTPVATPTPTSTSYRMRLEALAHTGQLAPGAEDQFNWFDLPSTGGGVVLFPGYTANGSTAGVWRFMDAGIGEVSLSAVAYPGGSFGAETFVLADSQPIAVNADGSGAFVGRLKNDKGEFTDFLFLVGFDGAPFTVVSEGDDAPGSNSEFSQFYGAQLANSGRSAFKAFADGNGIWLYSDGSVLPLVIEGQELPGLSPDWRTSGSNALASSGISDDGEMALFLSGARHTLSNGTDVRTTGIWVVGPNGSRKIAIVDDGTVDLTFKRLSDVSMNAAGTVVFEGLAETVGANGTLEVQGIWKAAKGGDPVKVAEAGMKAPGTDIEIIGVRSPLLLPDGRVAFIGSAFDDTFSLINFVMVESDGGFKTIARTDALPGPSGVVSLTGFEITQLSVNSAGNVAFQIGFGQSLWAQSPAGELRQVVRQGDSIEVTAIGGPVTKTVDFVQYLGGVATGSGQPTGFSDAGDLVFKVTCTDGTQVVMLARFESDGPGLVEP